MIDRRLTLACLQLMESECSVPRAISSYRPAHEASGSGAVIRDGKGQFLNRFHLQVCIGLGQPSTCDSWNVAGTISGTRSSIARAPEEKCASFELHSMRCMWISLLSYPSLCTAQLIIAVHPDDPRLSADVIKEFKTGAGIQRFKIRVVRST